MITATLTNLCTTMYLLLERKSIYQGLRSLNPIDRFLRINIGEPLQDWFGPLKSTKYAEALII